MINYISKNKFLLKAIPYLFVAGGFIIWFALIGAKTDRNYQAGLTNQTYNRATNCFLAVPVTERTPSYIKECYDEAETATGVKVKRYGHK